MAHARYFAAWAAGPKVFAAYLRGAWMAPTTLDELLALLPGLRRRRDLNADLLRLLLDRQKGECTWCGRRVPKGRRGWCSDECVTGFKLRCCSGTVRAFVEKRDGAICQLCGRDTKAAEAEGRKVPHPSYRRDDDLNARRAAYLLRLRDFGYARGRYREVDHDPPVIEGGGLCGPESLRLLCGVCHEGETTRLAKRRTKAQGGPLTAAVPPLTGG